MLEKSGDMQPGEKSNAAVLEDTSQQLLSLQYTWLGNDVIKKKK